MTDKLSNLKPSEVWELTDFLEKHGGVPKINSTALAESLLIYGYRIRPSVEFEFDREKLAEILRDDRCGHQGFPPAEWDYRLADSICSSAKEIIKVKK